jgi:hypothetical protein
MSDVMFDPSMLVPSRLDRLSSLIDWLGQDETPVYIPRTFYDLSVQRELRSETYELLNGRWGGGAPGELSGGDQPRPRRLPPQVELEEVRLWLSLREDVVPFDPSEDQLASYADQIEVRAERPEITQIRLEEWIFLQSNSYVTSRIKKPFTAFVHGGAVVVEAGARGLKRLEKRTLHVAVDEDDPLTALQHLRVAAKWIAVGGASAAALVQPLLGAAVGAGAGWFLLLDP